MDTAEFSKFAGILSAALSISIHLIFFNFIDFISVSMILFLHVSD